MVWTLSQLFPGANKVVNALRLRTKAFIAGLVQRRWTPWSKPVLHCHRRQMLVANVGGKTGRNCKITVPHIYDRNKADVLYRLLYRHDLSKYLRSVQISAGAYIFTISWGKIKNLSRLTSVLSLHLKFVHNHKNCPNSAATLLSP